MVTREETHLRGLGTAKRTDGGGHAAKHGVMSPFAFDEELPGSMCCDCTNQRIDHQSSLNTTHFEIVGENA